VTYRQGTRKPYLEEDGIKMAHYFSVKAIQNGSLLIMLAKICKVNDQANMIFAHDAFNLQRRIMARKFYLKSNTLSSLDTTAGRYLQDKSHIINTNMLISLIPKRQFNICFSNRIKTAVSWPQLNFVRGSSSTSS
jgi:hypothetical protein